MHVVTPLNMPPHEWWDLVRMGAHTFTPMAYFPPSLLNIVM
jgi:hypothetical protein